VPCRGKPVIFEVFLGFASELQINPMPFCLNLLEKVELTRDLNYFNHRLHGKLGYSKVYKKVYRKTWCSKIISFQYIIG